MSLSLFRDAKDGESSSDSSWLQLIRLDIRLDD